MGMGYLDARVTGINARPPFSSASISLSFPFLGSVFTCFHSFRFLQGLFPSFLSVRTWNFSFLFFFFFSSLRESNAALSQLISFLRIAGYSRVYVCVYVGVLFLCIVHASFCIQVYKCFVCMRVCNDWRCVSRFVMIVLDFACRFSLFDINLAFFFFFFFFSST